jgi:catechol 2,3-dioxygenase-like lactoylglutathione lyase family enzyme
MTLGSSDLVAFVATTDPTRARSFYQGALGLRLLEESPFASVFDAHGTILRVTQVEALTPAPFTVLGWTVGDAAAAVDELVAAGITFERFDGMEQDDRGLWSAPGGAKVAWFKDPDGNVLSVTQPS